jgi:hypothetical protein
LKGRRRLSEKKLEAISKCPQLALKNRWVIQLFWKSLLASACGGLVPRFPALRDDLSDFIMFVGLKSFDPPQADLRFKPHGRLDFEPKSFF